MAARTLTSNEIELARRVFQSAIDYERVRIHDRAYTIIQRRNSGMTPNGQIYVAGPVPADYALERPLQQSFFIHEMAHVWQKQCAVLHPIWSAVGNCLRHGFVYSRAYRYRLDGGRDLLDYRMEQQAQIIEDHFRLTLADLPQRLPSAQATAPELLRAQLETVLRRFLDDPSYPLRHR